MKKLVESKRTSFMWEICKDCDQTDHPEDRSSRFLRNVKTGLVFDTL